jgi:hypothetical protein
MEINMKTLIIGTVGACLLLPIIGADAQPLAPNVTPGALARFKVEAVSFHAISETGWSNWPGSDEIYVNIHDPARQVATRSRLFEGVDAGQTKKFPSDQKCILPIAGVSGPTTFNAYKNPGDRWSCSNAGAPGPLSFTVSMYERDYWIFDFPPGYGSPGVELKPIGTYDDYIGRLTVQHSMEELTALQVGQSKSKSSLVAGGANGIYEFTWLLTRLPDAEPVLGPVTRLHEPNP